MVVGLGLVFALLTSVAVYLDERYNGSYSDTSEGFSTAGRSINVGLTACVSAVPVLTVHTRVQPQRSPLLQPLGHSHPRQDARGRTAIAKLLPSALSAGYCEQVDVGRHTPSVIQRRLQVRRQRALLVCRRRHSAGLALRCSCRGGQAQGTAGKCLLSFPQIAFASYLRSNPARALRARLLEGLGN